jgi:hypothetical protein
MYIHIDNDTYIYAYIYLYIYIYTHRQTYMRDEKVLKYIHTHILISQFPSSMPLPRRTYTYTFIYIHIHTCAYIYTYMSTQIHRPISWQCGTAKVDIHIHIHIHTCAYIYIHTYMSAQIHQFPISWHVCFMANFLAVWHSQGMHLHKTYI